MDGGDLFVEQWLDLRRLPLVMDDAADQAARIVEHAVTWVARREGFEPSPLCLLRPLAAAMEVVGSAFEAIGLEFAQAWSAARDAVVAADAVLEASEQDAATALAALATRLGSAVDGSGTAA